MVDRKRKGVFNVAENEFSCLSVVERERGPP
jgi:hypothetical protein